jgi:hypothetical protein
LHFLLTRRHHWSLLKRRHHRALSPRHAIRTKGFHLLFAVGGYHTSTVKSENIPAVGESRLRLSLADCIEGDTFSAMVAQRNCSIVTSKCLWKVEEGTANEFPTAHIGLVSIEAELTYLWACTIYLEHSCRCPTFRLITSLGEEKLRSTSLFELPMTLRLYRKVKMSSFGGYDREMEARSMRSGEELTRGRF